MCFGTCACKEQLYCKKQLLQAAELSFNSALAVAIPYGVNCCNDSDAQRSLKLLQFAGRKATAEHIAHYSISTGTTQVYHVRCPGLKDWV